MKDCKKDHSKIVTEKARINVENLPSGSRAMTVAVLSTTPTEGLADPSKCKHKGLTNHNTTVRSEFP